MFDPGRSSLNDFFEFRLENLFSFYFPFIRARLIFISPPVFLVFQVPKLSDFQTLFLMIRRFSFFETFPPQRGFGFPKGFSLFLLTGELMSTFRFISNSFWFFKSFFSSMAYFVVFFLGLINVSLFCYRIQGVHLFIFYWPFSLF